jgi:hypothetical protein
MNRSQRQAGASGPPSAVERASIARAAVSYAGAPGLPLHVESGPVWSGDSRRVAILERQLGSGRMALTILSASGGVATVPVPDSARESSSLAWLDGRVAVGAGPAALVVDPSSGTCAGLDSESSRALEEVAAAGQTDRDNRRVVEEVLRRLGAREGVARPN